MPGGYATPRPEYRLLLTAHCLLLTVYCLARTAYHALAAHPRAVTVHTVVGSGLSGSMPYLRMASVTLLWGKAS